MSTTHPTCRKVKDIIIYEDAKYFSAFPSVVKRPDGELLLAFRRAPNRRLMGGEENNHVHPNSYLVSVRSPDGENWSKDPELFYAHDVGGSQDPCLLQLRDGTLLCASYAWTFMPPERVPHLKAPVHESKPGVVFCGGYYLKSVDGGKHWQGPFYPPSLPSETFLNPYGQPLPAYNRGAMMEGRDGRIFWVCAANECLAPRRAATHLLISEDKGQSWRYSCPVASDAKVTFSETSLLETPSGDLVAFMRTNDFDDEACIARSTDGGNSFQPWQGMGFKGHPLHALRLPDDRVLLVYGYRHEPFGIRCRILNAECTDFATATEMVLREDGGGFDIGYPWAVQLDATHVLVTYYFNVADGIRHIAGTILEID